MRIIFFASSHFAVASLEALIKSNHQIVCVVTQPDKQKGRHLKISGTQIKKLAQSAGLSIFQPENINSKESLDFLKTLSADLFIIISYGQILKQEVLDIPRIMTLNLHASLLPRYRGAAPINWAIINADKKSGVSVIYVTRKMDAGPIISQREIKIEDEDTSESLEEKMSLAGSRLLMESLKEIEDKNYRLCEQDEDRAVYAPKLKKETGRIDWNASSDDINNQIRGLLPWPVAFTCYKRKILKIFSAQTLKLFASRKMQPGEVESAQKEGIVVACGKGFLKIKELQLESGKRMSAKEFIAGHKLREGEVLGKI